MFNCIIYYSNILLQNVTLQLLAKNERTSSEQSQQEEEEEDEEEEEPEEKVAPNVQINGKKEDEDDEEKEIDEKDVEKTVQKAVEKSTPPEREEPKVPEATGDTVATEQTESVEEEVVPEDNEVPVHKDQEAEPTEVVTSQVTLMDTTAPPDSQADSQNVTETGDPSKAKPQEPLVSEGGVKPQPPTDASPKKEATKHDENTANPLGEAIVTDTRTGPPTQPPPPPPNVTHANTQAATPNR